MDASSKAGLEPVTAQLSYLADSEVHPSYRVYPPSSGRSWPRPTQRKYEMQVRDMRDPADPLDLDVHGLIMVSDVPDVADPMDAERVRREYYPAIEAYLKKVIGAAKVLAFDHNVRSVTGAARGQPGVRQPVDGAHNDYTEQSGPKRARELLEEAGAADLVGNRCAVINLWRPLHGPILDVPLAVCDARSVQPGDLVDTAIEHYMEDSLEKPTHTGHIYSLRHNPAHRWYYVSRMQRSEGLVFKGFDGKRDAGNARFVPHTGFAHPNCPKDPGSFVPRESIEVRTIVVYPEKAGA